jgi:hypothetical protein
LNILLPSGVLSAVRILVVFALLICPTSAYAQQSDEATLTETQQITSRVAREVACLAEKREELARIVHQMEEAQTQMRSASTQQAREHGRLALQSLTQRAIRVEREIPACRRELSARARRPGPPEGVTTRTEALDPNEAAVAQPNEATRVIERDAVLQPNVAVVVGQQVDGTGRVAPEEIRAAIRGAAARFSRCYDHLVDRGALTRGNIIVTFRVTSSGRTRAARAHHGTIDDRRFIRCMSSAARRIRVRSRPSGGDAVYSYTLRFPGR